VRIHSAIVTRPAVPAVHLTNFRVLAWSILGYRGNPVPSFLAMYTVFLVSPSSPFGLEKDHSFGG
jgi:hypothetical protein